jgi:hypothetical protein
LAAKGTARREGSRRGQKTRLVVAAAAAAAVVAATLLLSEEELECKAEAVPPQLGPVRREKDQHQ